MHIYTIEITNNKNVIEVQVVLQQNEIHAIIGASRRRFYPNWEPIEVAHARALRQATEWLEKGLVNLRKTGGIYAART